MAHYHQRSLSLISNQHTHTWNLCKVCCFVSTAISAQHRKLLNVEHCFKSWLRPIIFHSNIVWLSYSTSSAGSMNNFDMIDFAPQGKPQIKLETGRWRNKITTPALLSIESVKLSICFLSILKGRFFFFVTITIDELLWPTLIAGWVGEYGTGRWIPIIRISIRSTVEFDCFSVRLSSVNSAFEEICSSHW